MSLFRPIQHQQLVVSCQFTKDIIITIYENTRPMRFEPWSIKVKIWHKFRSNQNLKNDKFTTSNNCRELLTTEISNLIQCGSYEYSQIRVKWCDSKIFTYKNHSIKVPISLINGKFYNVQKAILCK